MMVIVLAVITSLLLLSGDVELNPEPFSKDYDGCVSLFILPFSAVSLIFCLYFIETSQAVPFIRQISNSTTERTNDDSNGSGESNSNKV